MPAQPGGATLEKGAAMESISGPKPVVAPAPQAPRISTSSTDLVAGQRAVAPAERSSRPGPDAKKASDSAQLQKVLEKLEARLSFNVSFDITFDDTIKREVVRGVSKVTGETVIEFPTEQMQRLIRGLREDLGLAVDKKA